MVFMTEMDCPIQHESQIQLSLARYRDGLNICPTHWLLVVMWLWTWLCIQKMNWGNDYQPHLSLLSKILKINKTEDVINMSYRTGLKLGLSYYRTRVDWECLKKTCWGDYWSQKQRHQRVEKWHDKEFDMVNSSKILWRQPNDERCDCLDIKHAWEKWKVLEKLYSKKKQKKGG